MNQHKRTFLCAASLLFVGMLAPSGRADVFIVSPGAQTSTEGNSNNGFPYNIQPFNVSSMRYQQVFGASDFSSLGGPELINKILFRPDAQNGSAFSSTLGNVQIDLSTTTKAPDGLSGTFANNVGGNDTVVYSGALSLSSSFTGPAGGPKAFDIVINLTTPFLYDPSAGNLLMDVRNFNGGATTQFDAQFSTDSVSRLYAFSSGATTGSADTLGLVAEFGFTPAGTPEPSSWLLLITVFGAVAFGLKRRLTA